MLKYDATTSENKCGRPVWDENAPKKVKFEEDLTVDQLALLGRLHCDAPLVLVKHMTELFNKVNAGEDIPYIFINGDLIGHKVASPLPLDPDNPTSAEIALTKKHYALL